MPAGKITGQGDPNLFGMERIHHATMADPNIGTPAGVTATDELSLFERVQDKIEGGQQRIAMGRENLGILAQRRDRLLNLTYEEQVKDAPHGTTARKFQRLGRALNPFYERLNRERFERNRGMLLMETLQEMRMTARELRDTDPQAIAYLGELGKTIEGEEEELRANAIAFQRAKDVANGFRAAGRDVTPRQEHAMAAEFLGIPPLEEIAAELAKHEESMAESNSWLSDEEMAKFLEPGMQERVMPRARRMRQARIAKAKNLPPDKYWGGIYDEFGKLYNHNLNVVKVQVKDPFAQGGLNISDPGGILPPVAAQGLNITLGSSGKFKLLPEGDSIREAANLLTAWQIRKDVRQIKGDDEDTFERMLKGLGHRVVEMEKLLAREEALGSEYTLEDLDIIIRRARLAEYTKLMRDSNRLAASEELDPSQIPQSIGPGSE